MDASISSNNSTQSSNGTRPKKSTNNRNVMKWTEEKDLLLMGEVTLINPYQYRKGSNERGKAWSDVADNLSKREGFKVDKRSVRDRVTALMAKIARKNAAEKLASGIAPEETEAEKKLTEMVEDIIQLDQDSENLPATGKTAADEQMKKDGIEMRKRSCETFGETSKRLKEGDSPRQKRTSGSDTSKFLLQKLEHDRQLKREEMELRRQENERKEKSEAERDRRYDLLQQQMQQQVQQHQQQVQQMQQQFVQSQNMMMMMLQNMTKDNKPQ